jgi:hypothetical protein
METSIAVQATTRLYRRLSVAGMIFFGTCCSINHAFIVAIPIGDERFARPVFQTAILFFGMSLSFIVYAIQRRWKCTTDQDAIILPEGFTSTRPLIGWKLWAAPAVPSILDLVSTYMQSLALEDFDSSLWQLSASMQVVSTLCFLAFVLKRQHYPYMWWSAVIVAVGTLTTSFSYVLSIKTDLSQETVVGVILALVSQILFGVRSGIEDYIMHDGCVDPSLLVGIEGIYGLIFTSFILMPIANAMKGNDDGSIENFQKTFDLLRQKPLIIGLEVLFLIVVLGLNVFLKMTINAMGAVVGTSLESARGFCTWAADILLRYCLKNSEIARMNPDFGEELTLWSILRLAGFLISVAGIVLCNRVLQMPCFHYPPPRPQGEDLMRATDVWALDENRTVTVLYRETTLHLSVPA